MTWKSYRGQLQVWISSFMLKSNWDADLSVVSEDRRILDWLSSNNVCLKHNDVAQKREPGTGEWVLETPEFSRWCNGSTRTLWCSGARTYPLPMNHKALTDVIQLALGRPSLRRRYLGRYEKFVRSC